MRISLRIKLAYVFEIKAPDLYEHGVLEWLTQPIAKEEFWT